MARRGSGEVHPSTRGSKEQRFLWGRSHSASRERLGPYRACREHKALGCHKVRQVPRPAPYLGAGAMGCHRPAYKESQPREALGPTPQEGGHRPTAPPKPPQTAGGLVPSTRISRGKLEGKGAA